MKLSFYGCFYAFLTLERLGLVFKHDPLDQCEGDRLENISVCWGSSLPLDGKH